MWALARIQDSPQTRRRAATAARAVSFSFIFNARSPGFDHHRSLTARHPVGPSISSAPGNPTVAADQCSSDVDDFSQRVPPSRIYNDANVSMNSSGFEPCRFVKTMIAKSSCGYTNTAAPGTAVRRDGRMTISHDARPTQPIAIESSFIESPQITIVQNDRRP